MSTEIRQSVESVIDELHRSAARELALAADSKARWPWRRHDVRRYEERAAEYLQAVKHLVGEL